MLFSDDANMVVIDEAHKLEENLINVLEGKIKLKTVFFNLDQIYSFLSDNIFDEDMNVHEYMEYINMIKEKFRYLFAYIRRSASISFNKNNRNNNSITDGDRLSFNFTKDILSMIVDLKINFDFILEKLNRTETNNFKEKARRNNLLIG